MPPAPFPTPLTLHADGDEPAACPQAVGGIAEVGAGVGAGDQLGSLGADGGPVAGAGDGGRGVAGGPAGQRLPRPLQPRAVARAGARLHFGHVWGGKGEDWDGGRQRGWGSVWGWDGDGDGTGMGWGWGLERGWNGMGLG